MDGEEKKVEEGKGKKEGRGRREEGKEEKGCK